LGAKRFNRSIAARFCFNVDEVKAKTKAKLAIGAGLKVAS
jgi:hypothetical protein